MARPRHPGVDDEGHDVVVYATGSTVAVAPDDREPTAETAVTDQFRRAATAVQEGFEHARQFHARPGPRLGAAPTSVVSNREGLSSDIVRPVLVDPRLATDLAVSGELFAEPIPKLRIEGRRLEAEPANLVWTASLRTGRMRRRAANLHVTASPSFNVTVLELIPSSRRRRGARAFLRVGLPAVEELVRRLQTAR